jgi:hypothetical protein
MLAFSVCHRGDGLVAAWDRGDAEAYGALFTEDASYLSFVGTVYRGRRDIPENHRALFAKFLKGTKLADASPRHRSESCRCGKFPCASPRWRVKVVPSPPADPKEKTTT